MARLTQLNVLWDTLHVVDKVVDQACALSVIHHFAEEDSRLGVVVVVELTVVPVSRETTARSGKVEAIKIHHLVPGSHEVTHELLLRVVSSVDLCECS